MGTVDSAPGGAAGPMGAVAAAFDGEYAAIGRADRLWDLAAEVFGEDYPVEVQPWGATTWWTLGRLVALARLRPGDVVIDVGCGRGGPGLWLARATAASLVGIDVSRVALADAAARAPLFVSAGTAQFLVGDLADTSLATGSADVVLCLDALPYAADRVGALLEARRLLRPGGRYLATAPRADWWGLCASAGLTVEVLEEAPSYVEHAAALAAVWSANSELLVSELGEEVADGLVQRARWAGLSAPDAQQVLVCARAAG